MYIFNVQDFLAVFLFSLEKSSLNIFIEVSIFISPLRSDACVQLLNERVRVCLRACVCACVRACACVCGWMCGTPGMGKGVEGPTHPSPPPLNIFKNDHRSLFPISTVHDKTKEHSSES